jgi:glycosyltransferase involved in cell wall biosynthesis
VAATPLRAAGVFFGRIFRLARSRSVTDGPEVYSAGHTSRSPQLTHSATASISDPRSLNSRICINALALRTGGGLSYVAELVPHIQRLHGAHATRVLVTRSQLQTLGWAKADGIVQFPSVLHRPLIRLVFESLVLPWALILWRCRSVLMCGNVGLLLCPVRQVIVQHASYKAALASRELLPRLKWRMLYLLGRASSSLADTVIYVSDALQKELVALGFPPGQVIHHGANPIFHALDREVVVRSASSRYATSQSVMLCVSDVYAHKNLALALRVLEAVRNTARPAMELVIAGAPVEPVEVALLKRVAAELGVFRQLHMIGTVTREELRDLYNAAEVVLAPSAAESFGMPLLEALRCGAPVVCSNIPAFREIAGETGFYFDPDDVEAATRCVLDALRLPRPYQEGIEHASLYSWEAAARQTLETLAPAHAGRTEPNLFEANERTT